MSADRVYRGGSCYYLASYARVAYRYGIDPSLRYGILGFRLVEEQGGE
jgi:formylglycine-generating enzyme required for sulfatase activity